MEEIAELQEKCRKLQKENEKYKRTYYDVDLSAIHNKFELMKSKTQIA